MEKAEDIHFHLWNTTYIFTAVKYSFLCFHGCEIQLFKICIIFNKYFPVFHYFVYNNVYIAINVKFKTKTVIIYNKVFRSTSLFQIGPKSLLRQGLPEPEFYGNFVYKMKKIVGSIKFSAQFIKIISHYKKDWL